MNAQRCSEIKELLSDTQLLKTVMNDEPYYPKSVKQFVVNPLNGFNNYESKEYRKVHVRGICFVYSLEIVNEYLSHGRFINIECLPSLKTVAR